MKRKIKGKIVALLAGLASLLLLGGCSLGESYEEVLANRNLVAQVTYYSNGGEFEGTPDKKVMWYKEGAKALNVGVTNPSNGTATIERTNYTFGGWYYAELDEDGNPVFENEEEGIYKLGEPVDFSVALKKDDHWIVAAKWIPNVKINVQLVCEDKEAAIPVKKNEITYKHGDVVEVRTYDSGVLNKPTKSGSVLAPFEVKENAYTFLEYYEDEGCTQLVQWPMRQQENDVTIYAKYLVGDWKVVRTADDALNMFNNPYMGDRYWLFQDIDATGKSFVAPTIFDCEIQGNGYTISNFKVTKSPRLQTFSTLGEIQSSAVIENVTFQNWQIEYTMDLPLVNIYFTFSSIAEGAKITNVKMSGKLTIIKSADGVLANIINGDYSSCLYGGYASDEAYITATEGKGFTVEGDPQEFIIINNL